MESFPELAPGPWQQQQQMDLCCPVPRTLLNEGPDIQHREVRIQKSCSASLEVQGEPMSNGEKRNLIAKET